MKEKDLVQIRQGREITKKSKKYANVNARLQRLVDQPAVGTFHFLSAGAANLELKVI